VHIATSGPENEIDCGASQSLELGIVFMLTDSCQPTVEDGLPLMSREGSPRSGQLESLSFVALRDDFPREIV